MSKTTLLRLALAFLLGGSLSQTLGAQAVFHFGRSNQDTLPERFRVSTEALREHIYQRIPDHLRNEAYPRSTFRFADQASIQLSYLFSSGEVYSDWSSFEDYLNQILQRVLPEELAQDSLIRVYLVKNGRFNAYVTPSGMIFLHIGLFDQVSDEATLAGILCHELAHHHLHHSIEAYVKRERGDFRPGFLLANKGAYSDYSIQSELDADALSARWLARGGYRLEGLTKAFEAMERWEKNYLARSKKKWVLEEYTHPRSERRLEQLHSYIKDQDATAADLRYFQVSQADFERFREEAKSEILQSLLHDFQYGRCTEKAFKYHLFESGNPSYLYYLMESIRRSCYLNQDLWRKKFIVHRYYEAVLTNNKQYKKPVEQHLFEQSPNLYLELSSEEEASMEAKFYWEDLKFITNEQAFVFFKQIAELVNEPECILSDALSMSFQAEVRNQLLRQYLANDNIRYRAYAECLLRDSIEASLPAQTLSVFSDFYVTIRQGKEEIMIREEQNRAAPYLEQVLQPAIEGFDERRYLYLPALQHYQSADYQLFQELQYLSFRTLYAKGDETKIHILDPRFWELMHQYGVNEMEFINCSYFDSRKADSSVEGYRAAIEIDYQSLLSEVKRHRYFDSYITSIREVAEGVSKVKSSGAEIKLSYRVPGEEQVVELLRSNLALKDQKTEEMDVRYRNATREAQKK